MTFRVTVDNGTPRTMCPSSLSPSDFTFKKSEIRPSKPIDINHRPLPFCVRCTVHDASIHNSLENVKNYFRESKI